MPKVTMVPVWARIRQKPTDITDLALRRAYTEAQWYTPDVLTYAAALTVDADTTNAKAKVTLTGNITISVTGGSEGQDLALLIYQDGTGNRTITYSGIAGIPPVTTTTANGLTVVYLERIATGWTHAF